MGTARSAVPGVPAGRLKMGDFTQSAKPKASPRRGGGGGRRGWGSAAGRRKVKVHKIMKNLGIAPAISPKAMIGGSNAQIFQSTIENKISDAAHDGLIRF